MIPSFYNDLALFIVGIILALELAICFVFSYAIYDEYLDDYYLTEFSFDSLAAE